MAEWMVIVMAGGHPSLIIHCTEREYAYLQQEGLAVASVARDVV